MISNMFHIPKTLRKELALKKKLMKLFPLFPTLLIHSKPISFLLGKGLTLLNPNTLPFLEENNSNNYTPTGQLTKEVITVFTRTNT